jgi:hypothetical protein
VPGGPPPPAPPPPAPQPTRTHHKRQVNALLVKHEKRGVCGPGSAHRLQPARELCLWVSLNVGHRLFCNFLSHFFYFHSRNFGVTLICRVTSAPQCPRPLSTSIAGTICGN